MLVCFFFSTHRFEIIIQYTDLFFNKNFYKYVDFEITDDNFVFNYIIILENQQLTTKNKNVERSFKCSLPFHLKEI